MNSEANNYCKNLVEVNKTNSVVVSEAIYNDQGVLLLARGSDLSEKRAAILLQHKLLKPLEQCVGIESSLNARQLYEFLNKFADNIPGLKAVTLAEEYQKNLRLVCLFYEKYPLLQQNLTVLALRAPRIYFQSLFCAMAGLAIALQLKLGLRELQTVFVAGLFHDVGFLYLEPELSVKIQEFTQEEWKALQAHPLIAKRFLDMIPDLPRDVGEAIANHHERIDGTGYPHRVFGDKLPLVSQIIAATDNIIFNHTRYQEYGPHAHNMLLTALKLSDNIYFEAVYDAATILFKQAPRPTSKATQLPSPQELLARQKFLQEQFEQTKTLSHTLMNQTPVAATRALVAVMGRLAIAIVRSGILQPEQEEWLSKLNADDENELILLETSVMLDQIYDQLVHVKNIIQRTLETIPQQEVFLKTLAEELLAKIHLQDPVYS